MPSTLTRQERREANLAWAARLARDKYEERHQGVAVPEGWVGNESRANALRLETEWIHGLLEAFDAGAPFAAMAYARCLQIIPYGNARWDRWERT